MADQGSMRVVFDAGKLTEAQRDGVACVLCGDEYAAHAPCGVVDGTQVFACTVHGECPTWCRGSHNFHETKVTHFGDPIGTADDAAHEYVSPYAKIPDFPNTRVERFVSMVGSRGSGRAYLSMSIDDARALAEIIEPSMGELARALRTAVTVLQDEPEPGAKE